MPFEPVILFFILGLFAGIIRSDLKIPSALYESISIFLLIAIGLKGGVELARYPLSSLAGPAAAILLTATLIPLATFFILKQGAGLPRPDAASIAAHYGSVSVVTFAVALSFLLKQDVAAEPYMPLLVALMEAPGIIAGIVLARRFQAGCATLVRHRELDVGD